MRISRMICAIAVATGWTLEYIGQLSYGQLCSIYSEITCQRRQALYILEYRLGQVMCVLANSSTHKYKPEQFVGDEPKGMEVTFNMTAKREPLTITLADGNSYTIPPLDVNIMEAVEDEFDKPWADIFKNMRIKVFKVLLFHLLKANYPTLTKEQVGALITVKEITAISKLIVRI